MLLRLEGEGVHIDTNVGRHVLVVLERLDKVEVGSHALSETILSVKLELSRDDGVGSGAWGTSSVATSSADGSSGHGVVSPVVGTTRDVGIALHNPNQFLNWMIEVKAKVGGVTGDGLITSELKLLNEVLVGQLSEAAALVSVEEDVINPERSVGEVSTSRGGAGEEEGLAVVELDVDLDLVVLEGDQREREPNVAAEPEL